MVTTALSHTVKTTKFIVSSTPRYGTFFVNTGCNRSCVYCSVPEEGSGIELPPETWYQITDRVVSWGVRLIGILGGEPTLRKDLPQIVGYASKKATVNLTSNGDTFVGTQGKERLSVLVSEGLSVLTLSLHDLTEVDRQLEILRFARQLGVAPVLGVVATKASIDQLPDIMRMANKQGVLFRYSLCQSIGAFFSSSTNGLSPTPEQISTFTALVKEQKRKTHLIQNTAMYLDGADLYPRGWHCDSYKDHWVVVDNEGRLMACSEHPTAVPVLSIPTLEDPQWVDTRTQKREACEGCTYQCYIEQEGLTRWDLFRESINIGRGLFQSRNA